jgi:hypothetical protein
VNGQAASAELLEQAFAQAAAEEPRLIGLP